MYLGFSGAQRTGKTTLAKAFAERHADSGWTYVEFSASAVLAKHGHTAKDEVDIAKRFYLQRKILEQFDAQMSCSRLGARHATTDRTPLDFLSYLQADITRGFPGALEKEYADFERDCLAVLASTCFSTVVVQPGISLVEDPKSAQASPAFMTHFNNTMLGISLPLIAVHVLPADILDLDKRLDYLNFLAI